MRSRTAMKSSTPIDDGIENLSRDKRRAIERRGKRALYDLPEELIGAIAGIAEKHRTTNSMIAGALLIYGIRGMNEGKIQLKDLCIPSDSPRYGYKIDLQHLIKRWGIKAK